MSLPIKESSICNTSFNLKHICTFLHTEIKEGLEEVGIEEGYDQQAYDAASANAHQVGTT